MNYYRIHTADTAYITKQPRGIFTAVGKLVDSGILSSEEERGHAERVYLCPRKQGTVQDLL